MSAQAKFVRVWRGRVVREKADDYERYWLANGIELLVRKGALAVEMLRDDGGDAEVEFVTFSRWPSLEAMAPDGGDPHKTHHLPRDPEFLIGVPDRVRILKILAQR